MMAMLVSDLRWSMGVFHYLIEKIGILTVENVRIDTNTKSMKRKIFVVE